MEIFIPSLLLGSGICLFAGVLFGTFGLVRRQDQEYLAFGVLSLLLGVYMVFSAQWYQADTVSRLANIARYEMAIVCLVYPVFTWFISLYTYRESYYGVLTVISFVFALFFIINIGSPYSFIYSEIQPGVPITLPWGEVVTNFHKVTAPIALPYYAATYATFGWAFYCCIALWKKKLRPRAISISVYLALQLLVVIHGELIDNLQLQSVYFGEFAFLGLVVLVTVTLVQEYRARSAALEKSIQDLRDEKARRQGYENRLQYLVYHDFLTDLPNRRSLSQQLDKVQNQCAETDTCGAMLLMDLDHFKMINDSLGHDLGDQLLQMVANRLKTMLPKEHTPIRLGGDEFAIFYGNIPKQEDRTETEAILIAKRICDEIIEPYQIDEHELVIGATIGIAIFDSKPKLLSDIMKQADMALYRAKSISRNSIDVFDPRLKKEADRRLAIDRGMRAAIRNSEIEVYFQPQVDSTGRVAGAEVLSRWQHPEFGNIPPMEFIGVAEETGLIHSLGENVLRHACLYLNTWDEQDLPFSERLSINISPWQLDNPRFVQTVTGLLDETGIQPARLNLEITESTFMRDIKSVSRKINQLSEMGITFSVDDFGTGYSALVWLKNLPLHELKIDRMFIHDMSLTRIDRLVETILAIAEHMGLRVVAEGVETEAQRQALESMGCYIFQGNLISSPVPAARFVEWLQDNVHQNQEGVTGHK